MGGKIALVDEYGGYLKVKEGRFQLKIKDKVKWDVAPVELDSIVFTVTGASISASAVELASQFGIDILFMFKNRPVARLIPATYGSTLKTWFHQSVKSEDKEFAAKISRLIVEAKIYNQRKVLIEYSRRLRASGKPSFKIEKAAREIENILYKVNVCSSPKEAMEIEAHASKHYWKAIAELLPEEIGFKTRLKKGQIVNEEQMDCFNKALNIGYGILKGIVWRTVFIAGLNPYIGFLHAFRAGRMSLVFDLMEPFRPISVDRPLIGLAKFKTKELLKLKSNNRKEQKEAVLTIWRTIVNYMGKSKPPHEALILEQSRSLAREIRGTGEFKPYKSRW